MPGPNRTQKQFAQSYRGNLAYLKKFHFFRTLRGVCFVLAVVGSLTFAFGNRYFLRSKMEFFSTGPISKNHANFGNNCQVCHEEANADLAKKLNLEDAAAKARELKLEDVKKLASLVELKVGEGETVSSLPPASPAVHEATGSGGLFQAMSTLSKYDAACMRCHPAYQLHQPAANALLLREFYQEIGLVHAGSCSTCHREHDGPGKMRLPPSNNCRGCHNNRDELVQGLVLLRATARQASPPSQRGSISTRSDGVRRFIPPRAEPHQPVAFDTFAGKHPAFGYEQPNLSDPAHISFNHARHFQDDISGPNGGRKLECIQCHRLGPDGTYMQRVSYEFDCKVCHSLTFDPQVPELKIPHGRPDDVRVFLHTLASNYLNVAQNVRRLAPDKQRAFIEGRLGALAEQLKPYTDSGLSGEQAIERRIFFVGDNSTTERITTKANTGQAVPACRKCHTVPDVSPGVLPNVVPTNIADRWLTRGPFTHAPHLHMLCIDCHGQAEKSSKTSDILMPGKAICGKCHRPPKEIPTEATIAALGMMEKNAKLVDQQKREGGIAFECQTCHGKFHAPAGAAVYAKQAPK